MAEKTHKPTAKKLRDARKRGEIVKSKELNSGALFAGLLAFLWLGGAFVTDHIVSVMERALSAPASAVGPAWPWLHEMHSMLWDAAWIVAPVLAIGCGSAVLIGALQTRGVFSVTPVAPKFERINPGQGLKNLFSMRQLFELLKMLVKTALLMALLITGIAVSLDPLVKMVYAPPAELLHAGAARVLLMMAWAAVIYALAAALDYAHQHHEFMKQQKMSVEELRRELRDTEGDVHAKARRRSTARELAFSKMIGRVPSASVVIANPTHVCVALYYEPGETDLPRVVAKGVDALALRIRAAAERGKVPVLEDAPLARWVFRDVELDQYVGEELIDAIAAVIRWARQVDCRTRQAPRSQAGS